MTLLSIKTNGVFVQKYLNGSTQAGSLKRMSIQDSCTLMDTFELFISTRYESIGDD
jgi:hypothetical protein